MPPKNEPNRLMKNKNQPVDSSKKQGTPHREIFTYRKHLMDYFTVDGVRLRTGYENKRDWYLLPIREMLDNDIDFLQQNYKGSDKSSINVDIKMDNKLFHLKIRNSNDANIPVFPNLEAIFDYGMRYGSKQDVHIISRGMLGDAMKQILSLGYVLHHAGEDAGRSFQDRQWEYPLIIRHNKKEWLISLKVHSAEQKYTVAVEPTNNQIPYTDTEIELSLPVIDEVRNSLTRDHVEGFCRKYALLSTDISFKFSIIDDITTSRHDDNDTDPDPDVESILSKTPSRGILHIDMPALHSIAKDWDNQDTIWSYTPEEFMRRFHNLHDKSISVYDILLRFREGTQITKTTKNEISVSQLVSSKDKNEKMEKLFHELRKKKYSKPQTELDLPYTTNTKKRKAMLFKRIIESNLYDINKDEEKAVYKLVRSVNTNGNDVVQYPCAFEILAIPFPTERALISYSPAIGRDTIVIGAVNYSVSPKDNYFDGEYYPSDKDREDRDDKPLKNNIYRALEFEGFRKDADYWVKLPCVILANLITPRRDPLSHDKSAIDAQPFINLIKAAVEMIASKIQTYRAGGHTFSHYTGRTRGEYRGVDKSASSVKDLLENFLKENIGLGDKKE